MPEVKPYAFSHAQFATLLMISMGIQRVLQVRSAYGGNEAAPICVEFLGESACTDESVMSLLHMKFHTALQCIILAAAVALQCWKTEPILRQLNALFILSPITTGLSTMFFAESISQGALLTQTMLGLVLAVVAAPSATNLPFCTGKYTSFMTLPSMALGSLALGNLVLAYQYVRLTTMTVRSGGDSDKITFPLLAIDPVFYQELPANMVTAVTTIVLFLAVDALTTALLYAHSWFALPDTHQRVRSSRDTKTLQQWDVCFVNVRHCQNHHFLASALTLRYCSFLVCRRHCWHYSLLSQRLGR